MVHPLPGAPGNGKPKLLDQESVVGGGLSAECAAGTPLSGASTSVKDTSRVEPVIYNSGG
jgi:hypothetical protein